MKTKTKLLANSQQQGTTSNSNENILPSARDCSIQQIVNDKKECASIPVSSTKIKHIADNRQQKHQQFGLFQKTASIEVSDQNCAINDPLPKKIKHTWSAGTCAIVGDSIITGIMKKRLTRNRLVKVDDTSVVLLQWISATTLGSQ